VDADRHHGAGLRTIHLVSALVEGGCDVLVVVVLADDDSGAVGLPESLVLCGREVSLIETTEAGMATVELVRSVQSFAPDAFVGITAMGAALACELVGDTPFWADVFGDLMAEAQAKAAVYDNDTALARFWGLLVRTLSRADRLSAVSARQADALVGQLGVAGRLSKATSGEALVHVVPCAAQEVGSIGQADVGMLRRRLGLEGAQVILWSGSFNTWCDVDTLFDAVTIVMQRCPQVHFVATGGAVAGHDERTYERFRRRVDADDLAPRFHLEGWVQSSQLPVYYALADVAVNVEIASYERRLGSENRVVEWLAAGVPVVTTAESEQGERLAAAGIVEAVAAGDADAISARLVELLSDADRLRSMSEISTGYARDYLGFVATAAPLVDWARSPTRSADAATDQVIRIGLVSEPKTMVALLEAYVGELGTAELLRRGARWFWRRLWRG
jgi:glycosyltransferase involved in cell wall biosynthesis